MQDPDGASWVAQNVDNGAPGNNTFASADIVLFNLDHHSEQFPLPRKTHRQQMFAVTGHAPTRNRPALWRDKAFTSLFDFTVHWGTGADVPLYFYDDEYGLSRNSSDVPQFWDSYSTVRHHNNFSRSALAGTLFFTCDGERIATARALQDELQLANYGPCMHNIGEKHTKIWRHPERKKALLGRNKFHLAWEVAAEAGWITDPLFDALRAGSVPIYYGDKAALDRGSSTTSHQKKKPRCCSPNHCRSPLSRSVPPGSVLYLDRLQSSNQTFVDELVALVRDLAGNKSAYFEYHKWRDDPRAHDQLRRNLAGNRYTAFHRMCQFYHRSKGGLPHTP